MSKGCMMLDFPALFAPARAVKGWMAIWQASNNDLKPWTVTDEMLASGRRSILGVVEVAI